MKDSRGTALSRESNTMRPVVAFDVVSIRPSNADSWRIGAPWGGDKYEAIGMPIGASILMAYYPEALQSKERIVGAPNWVWSDKFDLIGKIGEADLAAWQKNNRGGRNPLLEAMLQTALIDRCKLKVHRIPAQIDGLALVVAKRGPNLKYLRESRIKDPIPDRALKIDLDGHMIPIDPNDDPTLHFYQTSMDSFASELVRLGGLPVENRTTLAGKYDFDLTRFGSGGSLSSVWDLARLGLKLIPTKVLTENIVIDHIEKPSTN